MDWISLRKRRKSNISKGSRMAASTGGLPIEIELSEKDELVRLGTSTNSMLMLLCLAKHLWMSSFLREKNWLGIRMFVSVANITLVNLLRPCQKISFSNPFVSRTHYEQPEFRLNDQSYPCSWPWSDSSVVESSWRFTGSVLCSRWFAFAWSSRKISFCECILFDSWW